MASGDLTASTPQTANSLTLINTRIDALNLAAATDTIHVVPIPGRDVGWVVFKVEREAD